MRRRILGLALAAILAGSIPTTASAVSCSRPLGPNELGYYDDASGRWATFRFVLLPGCGATIRLTSAFSSPGPGGGNRQLVVYRSFEITVSYEPRQFFMEVGTKAGRGHLLTVTVNGASSPQVAGILLRDGTIVQP